jgi:very-short-patch-repair endonuclease
MLKIINKHPTPTEEAYALKVALEQKGVLVHLEIYDGYKHVDLCIPKAKIDVEVDGIRHLTDPHQILADLHRGYYSHKDGYNTMHIPNEMIHSHLREISEALAEASKIREQKLNIHVD